MPSRALTGRWTNNTLADLVEKPRALREVLIRQSDRQSASLGHPNALGP